MTNVPGLIINFLAETAIEARRLVKPGTADGQIVTASAGDVCIGVTTDIAADAGERADVTMTGIAPVKYGAAVTRGQLLKSDATGAAVPIATGDIAVGIAMMSGVANDIGSILLR